jgi:hypothetical protein
MFRVNFSPNGRGCREAAGEGYKMKKIEEIFMVPLTQPAGAGHPLPLGEGFAQNIQIKTSSATITLSIRMTT